MKRILRIINRFNLGGPTYNAAYLTRELEPEYKTLLVGGSEEDHEESSEFILDEIGVERERIPELQRSIDPRKDRKVLKELRSLIRRFNPDIVHTHASKAGVLGRWAAYREGVPLVYHTFHGHVFHSYFGVWKTRFYKAIERYLARRSTRLIALSEEQKWELTELHRIASPEKVEVIPLGFDLSRFRTDMEEKRARFRKEWGMAEDELAIAIVGRSVAVKGHGLFLQAFAELKARTRQRVRAFVVGDGEDQEKLIRMAKELGLRVSTPEDPDLNAELLFTSWIRRIDELWAGMDIATLTSHNEGTPVSLIEAHAAGLPAVSTRVGGVASIVEDGGSGLLLDEREPSALAGAWSELLEDEKLRDEWGKRGRERVQERFSVERLAEDTIDLYRRGSAQLPD